VIIDVQPYALILSYGVPAILFLSIIVAGFLTLYARRAKLSDRLEFAGEFRNRFVKYCNSEGQDTETYNWLILNCNKMQTQMGKYGVYRAFRPPYENYIINNYPIVLNMIPEVRKRLIPLSQLAPDVVFRLDRPPMFA
jgi:hypothetical protein